MILLIFLVIAEGFGYRYYATMESSLTREPSDSPENYALNFFVITILIFGIGGIQYIVSAVLSPMYPHDYTNFVDMCSMANISIIMFNEDLNGYYIHGKSASGNSDVSSEKLRLNLEAEIQGNATIRGIHPSIPEAQTFEIFLPNKMIDDYKKNFLTPVMITLEKGNKESESKYNAVQRAIT